MKHLLTGSVLIIFLFALMPGQVTPAFIVNHDKAAHATAFFMLALMLHRSFVFMPLVLRVFALVLMGLSIEIMQYLFAHRGFSFEDIVYDLLGITLYTFVSIPTGLTVKVFYQKTKRTDERI